MITITMSGVLILLLVGLLAGYAIGWLVASTKSIKNKKKSECNKVITVDEHERAFISKIIELLKTEPEKFTARWSGGGDSLDSSVQSSDKQILIMFDGQILQPIRPTMATQQKLMIQELITPIIKKDSEYLVNKLLKG